MSKRLAGRFSSSALRWAGGVFLGVALCQSAAQAQVVVARPYWWCIDDRLSYALACRTLAEARVINAKAYSMELDNWKKYVEVYWDRRHIWEAEFRKRYPEEWKVEEERQKRMTKYVTDQYQWVLKGDTTRASNWILRELANSVVSFQSVSGKTPIQPEIDCKLTAQDLKLIRLTDRGRNGKALEFAVSDDNVLLPPWPFVLLAPAFDKARENYERTQKAVVDELKTTHKFTYQNHEDLVTAIEKLYTALGVAYPEEDRKKDTRMWGDYRAAKQAIDILASNATRAGIINDVSAIEGHLSFKGDSLFALVQHMYRNGLEFAPPQRGKAAEGAYIKLFQGLRQIYVGIGPNDHAAVPRPHKAIEANQGPDDGKPPAKPDEPQDDRAT
jgi:hypothetical protein